MRLFLFSSANPDLGAAEDRGADASRDANEDRGADASRDADEDRGTDASRDVSAPPEDLGPESLRPLPDTASGWEGSRRAP